MIKVSVNVEVFFFTTIVSVTDQFWLTSLRVKWMRSAKWIVDLCSTLKDDKEMAINGFRSAGITEAIENAKDMVEKIENLFQEVRL